MFTFFKLFLLCLLGFLLSTEAAALDKNGTLIVEQINQSRYKKSEAILTNIIEDMVSGGKFCYCQTYFFESKQILDKVVNLFNSLSDENVEFAGRRKDETLTLCIHPKGREPESEPDSLPIPVARVNEHIAFTTDPDEW